MLPKPCLSHGNSTLKALLRVPRCRRQPALLCLSADPEGLGPAGAWQPALTPGPDPPRQVCGLLSLLGTDRRPASQLQGLLLAACEARITAVPQLGSCPARHQRFVVTHDVSVSPA